jgi:hypothetical protein
MAHKDLSSNKIEDWARQNKNKKYESQKLMQGDSMVGKISLGVKFL